MFMTYQEREWRLLQEETFLEKEDKKVEKN